MLLLLLLVPPLWLELDSGDAVKHQDEAVFGPHAVLLAHVVQSLGVVNHVSDRLLVVVAAVRPGTPAGAAGGRGGGRGGGGGGGLVVEAGGGDVGDDVGEVLEQVVVED